MWAEPQEINMAGVQRAELELGQEVGQQPFSNHISSVFGVQGSQTTLE